MMQRYSQRFHADPPYVVPGVVLSAKAIGGKSLSDQERYIRHEKNLSARAVEAAIVEIHKAPIQPTTIDSFVQSDAGVDFASLSDQSAVVPRIPGVVRAPMRVRLVLSVDGTIGYVVDEGDPDPLSGLSLHSFGTLAPRKIVAVSVVTVELLRAGAEEVITGDLARASAAALDLAMFDPNRPGSLTAAGALIPSSGDVGTDWANLVEVVGGGAVVCDPATGGRLAIAFPAAVTIGPGGRAFGMPLFVTRFQDGASPATRFLTLLDGNSVLFAHGPVELQATTQAALQMSTTPSGGATQEVPLWQNNLAALRAIRFCSWHLRRTHGCATITNVSF